MFLNNTTFLSQYSLDHSPFIILYIFLNYFVQFFLVFLYSLCSVQNSLSMEVEELEQNDQISLSVERKRGTFGRLTVHWAANGSLADIYPTSGVVSKL